MKQRKRSVVLGITGSIAAYKAAELARQRRDLVAAIDVAETEWLKLQSAIEAQSSREPARAGASDAR